MERRRLECGAVLAEFSIGAVLLLALIAALCDVGMGLHRWGLLTHIGSAVVREEASYGSSCPDPAEASEHMRRQMREFLGTEDFPDPVATVEASGVTGRKTLNIEAVLPLSCMFCGLLPGGVSVHSSSRALIERGC